MAIRSALALLRTLSHLTLALATGVTPLASRPYGPRPGSCVNGPQSRGCWKGDFDIYTDYDTKVPQGRLREVCDFIPLLVFLIKIASSPDC